MSVNFRILQSDAGAAHLLGIAKQQAMQYIEGGSTSAFEQNVVIGKNTISTRANKVGTDWEVRIRLIAGADSGGFWTQAVLQDPIGRRLTIYRGGKTASWGVSQTQTYVTVDSEHGSYNIGGYYTLYINGVAVTTLEYSGNYFLVTNWPGGVPLAPRPTPGTYFFAVYTGTGDGSGTWSFPFDSLIQEAINDANAETKTRFVLTDGTELAAVVSGTDGRGHYLNLYRDDISPWQGETTVQLYNDTEYGTAGITRTPTPGIVVSLTLPEDVVPPVERAVGNGLPAIVQTAAAKTRDRARRVTATTAILNSLKNGILPKEIHVAIKATQLGSTETKQQPKLAASKSSVTYTTSGNQSANEPWSYTFTSTTRVGYSEVEPGGRVQKDEDTIIGTFKISATPIFGSGGDFRFFIYKYDFDNWLIVGEDGGSKLGNFVYANQSTIVRSAAYGNIRPAILELTGIDIHTLMRNSYASYTPADPYSPIPAPSYDATFFDKPPFTYSSGTHGFYSVLQVRSGTITFGPVGDVDYTVAMGYRSYTNLLQIDTGIVPAYSAFSPPIQFASDTCVFSYPSVVQRYRAKYRGPTASTTPLAQDYQPVHGTLIHVIPISIQHTELGNLGMFPRTGDITDVSKLTCRVDNVFYLKYDYVSGTFSFVKDKDKNTGVETVRVGKFTTTVNGAVVDVPYKTFPFSDQYANLAIRTNTAGYKDVAAIFKEQQGLIKKRDGVDEPVILFFADLEALVKPLL